jgi:NADPH:quinone reductase-like Zn-dependent oxidoreductase
MKGAVRLGYGSPSVLSVREIELPTPRDNEVLVRVYATTVNRTDCHVLSGRPFVMRLFTGLLRPRVAVTGSDFAGQIEETGQAVRSFKVRDRVMGFRGVFGGGSHAQYLTFAESGAMTLMPTNMTYDQAAACLEGAIYAMNGVMALDPRPDQTALVNGATGAIGSSMVQLLRYHGVKVTAVCGSENRALVMSLGAEGMIDYRTEDFTKDDKKYDFVLDAVGMSTFSRSKRLLKPAGVYTSSGGFQNLFLALATRLSRGRRVVFPPPRDMKASLDVIRDLAQEGTFKPVIDRKYRLEEIIEAFEYVASGNKIGSVIISIDT